jgi:hypothetical protein
MAMGKNYDNKSVEKTLTSAFANGCARFDVFYMTGLPEQTVESAMNSSREARNLWNAVGKNDKLYVYTAPFAPFVDPGSRAFEEPERFGYKFFARTLDEHRALLENPSWKHVLSYETKWMTRDMIADVSYDAALELAHIELECGRTTQEAYDERVERTNIARDLLHRIDDILLIKDESTRTAKLWDIKEEGERMMASTVCNKKDLDWDAGSIWSNAPRVVMGLVKHSWPFERRKKNPIM